MKCGQMSHDRMSCSIVQAWVLHTCCFGTRYPSSVLSVIVLKAGHSRSARCARSEQRSNYERKRAPLSTGWMEKRAGFLAPHCFSYDILLLVVFNEKRVNSGLGNNRRIVHVLRERHFGPEEVYKANSIIGDVPTFTERRGDRSCAVCPPKIGLNTKRTGYYHVVWHCLMT